MVDIGLITGSGVAEIVPGAGTRRVQTGFGEAEVAVAETGGRTVGCVSRHGEGR